MGFALKLSFPRVFTLKRPLTEEQFIGSAALWTSDFPSLEAIELFRQWKVHPVQRTRLVITSAPVLPGVFFFFLLLFIFFHVNGLLGNAG